jgi:parallel beta-helix repeat protein
LKIVTSLLLTVILVVGVLSTVFTIHPVKAGTITVPDDYATIQEAINHANDGDTVLVRNGTYFENVVVNKSLSLVGQDRALTFIDGGGIGNVTTIASNGVAMSGFTVRNSGGYPDGGVVIRYADSCSVYNNAIADNYYGIEVRFSSHVTLAQNDISLNDYSGAWIHQSSYNTLLRNNITENYSEGIVFSHSLNDAFVENLVTSNGGNGVFAYYLSNCRLCNNTLFGNGGVGFQLIESSDNNVSLNMIMNNDEAGIDLIDSSGNVLADNTIINNTGIGIEIWESARNSVIGNTVTGGHWGVALSSSVANTIEQNRIASNKFDGLQLLNSSGNTIVQNEVANNTDGGIDLSPSSSSNVIFHNNFVLNPCQSGAYNSNTWDNGYPDGGNYWSNYVGADTYRGPQQDRIGGDGIGDAPYTINENNTDRYPLMKRWLIETIKGDITHDGTVNIFDIVAATSIYSCRSGDQNWNPDADLAPPYGIIDIFDLLTCVSHYGEKYP